MSIPVDKTRAVLMGLAQVAKDGEIGFDQAAQHLAAPELKESFLQWSRDRAAFVDDLHAAVSELGGVPNDESTLAGALHRGWIDVRAALHNLKDPAIVAEAERGERGAVEEYKKALREDVPTRVRDLIESQFEAVLATHNELQTLRLRMETEATRHAS